MAKKKREPEEEAEAGERWLVSYADMMTLLVALFIVLFAMADVSSKKFEALKESFNGHPAVAEAILQGSDSVIDGGDISKIEDDFSDETPAFDTPNLLEATGQSQVDTHQQVEDAQKVLEAQDTIKQAREEEKQTLAGVQEEIEAALAETGQQGAVKFTTTSKGLTITVITDQVLFDSGSATLRPQSGSILAALGAPLSKVANDISVEGYTDDTPINTSLYPSNWELSNRRATSVLRFLVEQEGVGPTKIGATGYGEYRPLVPNDTPEHRAQNRRVEITVLSSITTG